MRLVQAAVLSLPLVSHAADDARTATHLNPVVVTATRMPQPVTHLPVTVDVIRAEAFAASPSMMVDDTLKTSAAFSLFRRTGSLMANPTAQGVSLRNLGPSGAGRTLVLLDGIPLNDPFGGWVTWTKIPRLSLAGAEIVRGGGSSAWGSAALGGTIQFISSPLIESGPSEDLSSVAALVEAGDASTRAAEVQAVAQRNGHHWRIGGRAFETDGFWRVPAGQRGTIDRRTDSQHHLAQVAWSRRAPNGLTSGLELRVFDEDRGNGTPLQRNQTQETFAAGRLGGSLGGTGEWAAVAYAQIQEFSSLFTSVNETRTAETPALDQYEVPAEAAGAAWTGLLRHDQDATTAFGLDGRWVRGETREAYFLQNGAFTRRRRAGGEQSFLGVFAQHDRALSADWRWHAGARADYWQLRDGHRRETDAATGAVLREETFATVDGVELSPRLGVVWNVASNVRARTAAYRAFRVPTLNELYRPFRVGNVITEANPQLDVETVEGVEVGADGRAGAFTWSATAFHNRLDDAVANVTLGTGPGEVPGVGFVPAGGVGRQRRNLDRVRVQGIELAAAYSLGPILTVRADYLYSDATVEAGGAAAAPLTGRRLAQVPRHTLALTADWRPDARWQIRTHLRHVSRAFEDDLNQLTLAAATTVDVRLSYRFGVDRRNEVFVTVQNVFDEKVQAGRDADGRVDLGEPRFVHGGLRWQW